MARSRTGRAILLAPDPGAKGTLVRIMECVQVARIMEVVAGQRRRGMDRV